MSSKELTSYPETMAAREPSKQTKIVGQYRCSRQLARKNSNPGALSFPQQSILSRFTRRPKTCLLDGNSLSPGEFRKKVLLSQSQRPTS